MIGRQLSRAATQVLVVGVVAVVASSQVAPLLPSPTARVAEASVAADKKDDRKSKDDKERDDDRGDDFVLIDLVLEMDTDKNSPEMIVGTVDGRALVRVLKTDEIDRNGIGDYVELTGEKITEQLFGATEISVGERFAGPDPGTIPSRDSEPDASDYEPD